MPEKKSKFKDPYLSRNEFKKGFYDNQPEPSYYDKYGDRGRIESVLADVDQLGNVVPSESSNMPNLTSGRSPEEYQNFKQMPYQKGSYKEGGDIHIEKGESYIKDLIK